MTSLPSLYQENRSDLYLPAGHVAHYEADGARRRHRRPEARRPQMSEANQSGWLAGQRHQRHEHQAGVKIVIKGQPPDGVPDQRQRFFRADSVEGDEQRGQHAVGDARR